MFDNDKLLIQFSEEKICEYKGRRYLVRDNGAAYKLRKINGKASKWDEIWTFGRKDDNPSLRL